MIKIYEGNEIQRSCSATHNVKSLICFFVSLGITSKLDYIVESGISTIGLSPIYTSPMVNFGYDISDFTDVDPIFGNLKDFRALLARAKELDLKVRKA